MGASDEEDVSWYICPLCNQAFNAAVKLRTHTRDVHDSKQNGVANVLILSQELDLQPKVKIRQWSGLIAGESASFSNACRDSSCRLTESKPPADNSDEGDEAGQNEENGLENGDVQVNATSRAQRSMGDAVRKWAQCKGTLEARQARTCPICHREFSTKSKMVRHQKDIHVAVAQSSVHVDNGSSSHSTSDSDSDLSSDNHEAVENGNAVLTEEVKEVLPEIETPTKEGKAESTAALKYRRIEIQSEAESAERSRLRFACTVCSKHYGMVRNLKRHVKNAHNVTPDVREGRTCPICRREFSRRELMKRHQRKAHADVTKGKPLKAESEDARPVNDSSSSSASDKDSHSLKSVEHWAISDGSASDSLSESDVDDDGISPPDLKKEVNAQFKEVDQPTSPPIPAKKKKRPAATLKVRKVNIKIKGADGSTSSTRFGCTLCSKDYAYTTDLRRHVKNVHNSTQEVREGRTCPISQREFCAKQKLKKHQQEVHVVSAQGAQHLCPTCGIRFKTPARLQGHQKRMHGPRERKASLECDVCGRPFFQVSDLKRHKLTHQPGDGDFICDQCGKGFNTVDRMNRHRKLIHAGFRPFKCGECGNGFVNKQVLDMHGAVHTDPGVNPFPCTQCPKAYKTKTQLRIHTQNIHSGRCHLCRVCGQQFHNKFTAMNHEHRKHNFQRDGVETNRFECRVCKKTFLSSGHLKEHQLMHTDDRPQLCATCGKGFKTKNGLDHHLKVSHRPNAELPHPCEVCGKRFGYASYLAKHKRGVHGHGEGSTGNDKTD